MVGNSFNKRLNKDNITATNTNTRKPKPNMAPNEIVTKEWVYSIDLIFCQAVVKLLKAGGTFKQTTLS